jgi:hypothetical protein
MDIEKELNDMKIQKDRETINRKYIPKKEELISANGSSKSKEREFSEPDWLQVDTVRIRDSISTKVSPQ